MNNSVGGWWLEPELGGSGARWTDDDRVLSHDVPGPRITRLDDLDVDAHGYAVEAERRGDVTKRGLGAAIRIEQLHAVARAGSTRVLPLLTVFTVTVTVPPVGGAAGG